MQAEWSRLPEPVVCHILSFLTEADRCHAGQTCTSWHESMYNPALWRTMKCGFFLPEDKEQVQLIANFGRYVKNLTISVNQTLKASREDAVAAIELFASFRPITLTHFSIQFKGENPFFYKGQEFLMALNILFWNIRKQSAEHKHIRYLNFREIQIDLDANLIACIAESCSSLEYLNILNDMIICNVTSDSIVYLVKRCTKLKEIHLYHSSLSDEVLEVFSQPGRHNLQRLGFVCRREEKYRNDISEDAWRGLVKANPYLRVELGFDHTCPLHRISEVMSQEIPVQDLHFATFTTLEREIELAKLYFSKTIEKLVINTKPDKDFENELLSLVGSCTKLHTLCVYGVISQEIIDQILTLNPQMKAKGSYILKSEMEPEPWTVGEED